MKKALTPRLLGHLDLFDFSVIYVIVAFEAEYLGPFHVQSERMPRGKIVLLVMLQLKAAEKHAVKTAVDVRCRPLATEPTHEMREPPEPFAWDPREKNGPICGTKRVKPTIGLESLQVRTGNHGDRQPLAGRGTRVRTLHRLSLRGAGYEVFLIILNFHMPLYHPGPLHRRSEE
jgi:hypothetical protein